METRFRIGVITATHGLRGEVKVFPTTEDPGRYKKLEKTIAVGGAGETVLFVEQARFFRQYVIVKFKGIDRIEEAEPLVRRELYVTREDAIPLEEGEYYVADLIGLTVVTEDGEKLGILEDVLRTGANDVYVVSDGKREILIPVIPQCILNVDLEEGMVKVHLLKGLVD